MRVWPSSVRWYLDFQRKCTSIQYSTKLQVWLAIRISITVITTVNRLNSVSQHELILLHTNIFQHYFPINKCISTLFLPGSSAVLVSLLIIFTTCYKCKGKEKLTFKIDWIHSLLKQLICSEYMIWELHIARKDTWKHVKRRAKISCHLENFFYT